MLKDLIVRFDTAVTGAIQRWPRWLRGPMLVITNLGQPAVMGVIGIATMTWAIQHQQKSIAYSMAAALATIAINGVLKHYIHRTRPDTLYVSKMYFQTSSFPSGHTVGVTVVCGLLFYVSWHYVSAPAGYWVGGGLASFTMAVGLSRIYLGAHFPTDVVAGWMFGLLAVIGIVLVGNP